jgi:hypothetical protein
MRTWLLLLVGLSACSAPPKSEKQIADEQGIKPVAGTTNAPIKSYDGPFGIAKGQPLSALDKPQEVKPGFYRVMTVPQPYPNINSYIVQNTAQHGTCMVKALSNDIESDSFGGNIRTAVDHVRDDLIARYGKPKNSFDFLQEGSIWRDPQDWMMALGKSERTYSFFWAAPRNADPKIWRGVESVGLMAGSDGRKGWFTIEYDFVGNKECDDDLKRKAAQAL